LALSKPARQYRNSDAANIAASKAVDGNRRTMSCTWKVVQPWWAVDLGQYYPINRVTITFPNTTDNDRCSLIIGDLASFINSNHETDFSKKLKRFIAYLQARFYI